MGFEPMASACSTNSASKTHTLEAGQFFEFILIREWNGIWNEDEKNRTEQKCFSLLRANSAKKCFFVLSTNVAAL